MSKNDEEIWKDIPDWPFYQASTWGRIRSIDKETKHNYGGICKKKGKVLSSHINGSGYRHCGLVKAGKTYGRLSIARLVCQTFKENPFNLPIVNHLDGNKLNDRPDNLEWCTQSRNMKHAYEIGLKKPSIISKEGIRRRIKASSKKVILFNLLDGGYRIFEQINKCAEYLNVDQSCISQSLRRNSLLLKRYIVQAIDAKTITQ